MLEPLREIEGDGEGIRRGSTRPRTSVDGNPPALQYLGERPGSRCGGSVHTRERKPADGERRQWPRLDPEVGRLPAERIPSRVEVRVVAEHATFDSPDPGCRDAACEPVQIRPGEGRVAEPDEEEVAAPGAPCPGADAHDLGMEAKARAEHVQRGERDPELLDRRRQE